MTEFIEKTGMWILIIITAIIVSFFIYQDNELKFKHNNNDRYDIKNYNHVTFLIDKHTGLVWRNVRCDGNVPNCWQIMTFNEKATTEGYKNLNVWDFAQQIKNDEENEESENEDGD